MKIKVKTRKRNTDLTEALDEVAEARLALDRFRRKNAKFFEQLIELESMESAAVSRAKALALEEANKGKGTERGQVLLIEHNGQRIMATYKREVDGNKLFEKYPDVREIAKVRVHVTQEELRRLIAMGVLKQKEADTLYKDLTPSISVVTDQLNDDDFDPKNS